MKSIILKSIPFLIAFVGLNLLIYNFSNFYLQEKKYINRIECTINNKSEVIFLGDSHVETIKQLDLNNSIGNLAFGADGVEEMYTKVLIMLKYNKNLEYVFIATEPQIFSNVKSPNSTFLKKYTLKIEDTLDVYDKSFLDLITDKVPLFNDNYIKYTLNELLNHLRPKQGESEVKWSTLSESQRDEIATKTGQLDHRTVLANDRTAEIYKALVDICKQNNIKVIGIRFPVNENYINQCDQIDLMNVNAFVKSLNLYQHIDYSTKIKSPEYFEDEDHLNEKGIEKFAQIIYEETNIKLSK